MAFFDRPVERPEELFDKEKELDELKNAISSRAVTVVGARRISKHRLLRQLHTVCLGSMQMSVKFEFARYVPTIYFQKFGAIDLCGSCVTATSILGLGL